MSPPLIADAMMTQCIQKTMKLYLFIVNLSMNMANIAVDILPPMSANTSIISTATLMKTWWQQCINFLCMSIHIVINPIWKLHFPAAAETFVADIRWLRQQGEQFTLPDNFPPDRLPSAIVHAAAYRMERKLRDMLPTTMQLLMDLRRRRSAMYMNLPEHQRMHMRTSPAFISEAWTNEEISQPLQEPAAKRFRISTKSSQQ